MGPSSIGRATWTLALADRRASVAPSTNVAPTYTVRILDQTTGSGRTIVDRASVPSSDGPLVASAPAALPSGALTPGSVYRLEIAVRIPFGASAGDGAVDVGSPQLTVEPATAAPAPTPVLPDPSLLAPVSPSPTPSPAADDHVPHPDQPGSTSRDGDLAHDALRTCLGENRDLAVVGASGTARRLTIEGHADAEAGTAVELVSVDGWKLGRTLVDDDGLFNVSLPEPRGSAGTRRVFARLADGSRSDDVAVERRNVITNDRWASSRVELRGTLAPGLARRGRMNAVLDLSGADPCALTRRVRATRFDVDRGTGVYRAVFRVRKTAVPAGQNQVVPPMARLSLGRTGSGTGPRTLTSQMIFGPASDTRGT